MFYYGTLREYHYDPHSEQYVYWDTREIIDSGKRVRWKDFRLGTIIQRYDITISRPYLLDIDAFCCDRLLRGDGVTDWEGRLEATILASMVPDAITITKSTGRYPFPCIW